MEPFADFARIFPGFPDRNISLSDPTQELIELVRNNSGNLYFKKYPLFYKPGGSRFRRGLDSAITGKSAVDTVRDSTSYYKAMISKVDKNLLLKLAVTLSKVELMEELQRYYS